MIQNETMLQTTESQKRLDWIDALRALAVIFVVFGHQVPENTLFFVLTSPIKMPLFFLISGFVFKGEEGNVIEMVKYLVFRLFIPWLFLSLIWLRGMVWIAQGEGSRLFEELFRMLSGKASWYMTCYIIASAILFLVYKLIKKDKARIDVLFGLGCFGFALKRLGIGEFAELNNALLVQFYMVLGILLKKNLQHILNLPVWTVVISTGIYVTLAVLTCVWYPGECIDVNTGMYYNYAISLPMIFAGNYIIVRTAEGLSRIIKMPRALVAVGQNTLVIYLLHGYIITGVKHLSRLLRVPVGGGILWAIGYTICAVTIGTIIGVLLNRFCPALTGSKRIGGNKNICKYKIM